MGRSRTLSTPRIVGAVAFIALLVAMLLNTRFFTPEELASAGPEEFEPSETAERLYTEASETLAGRATPMPELLTGLHDDVAKTAEKYDAAKPNDTTYVFAVEAKAKIVGNKQVALDLKIDGVPPETPVSLAQGPAVNGTMLRDALGFEFGDAPNQTAYQGVGNELKAMMQGRLANGLPGSPQGKRIRLLGLLSITDTGVPLSPRKPLIMQPVTVEAER